MTRSQQFQTLLTSYLRRFLGVLRVFPDRSPLRTPAELTDFLRARASFVAQTELHAYLRARMGTKFTQFFQDAQFSVVIREAAIRLFASCLADLCIHAAAKVAQRAGLRGAAAADLAQGTFAAGLAAHLVAAERALLGEDHTRDFATRSKGADWGALAENSSAAFAGSIRDLVRLAPVVDEFKTLDAGAVQTAIRLRWRDIRAELDKRLDAGALARALEQHARSPLADCVH